MTVGLVGTLLFHAGLLGAAVVGRFSAEAEAEAPLEIGADLSVVTIPLAPEPEQPKSMLPEPVPEPAPKDVLAPPEPPAILVEVPSEAAPQEPAQPIRLALAEVLPVSPAPEAIAVEESAFAESAATEAAERTWETQVLAALERKKRYPLPAQRRREEDTVYIVIVLDRSGAVLESRVKDSRGIPTLDAEAVELGRRVSPLPPPPESITGDRIELIVPVEFFMRRGR